jgi:uncharacterized protein
MSAVAEARELRVEDVRIPLSDGCELFARIWRPAASEPVPAIVEATPYGASMNDLAHHDPRNRYLARRGYACVDVELRGSGNSDGLPLDEYVLQEQDDLVEAIAWLAAQPWCSGSVGMVGISWGGFNVLQVAARRPPALRAIVSACSSGDRYRHDVHYLGGAVLANEALGWATDMMLVQSRPPDPQHVGEGWRERWRERLESIECLLGTWLAHQRRDDYWRHGSVCEDWAAIACPALVLGGWQDGYVGGTLELVEGIPRAWGLVGQWAHAYPEIAAPGPAIGFLEEVLRWWDRWLKGIENGVEQEPRLRAFIRDPRPPRPLPATEEGRWVGLPDWPRSTRLVELALDRTLLALPVEEPTVTFRAQQSAGLDSPVWCPYGDPSVLCGDQRGEDGRALSFTTLPLAEPLDLLGAPAVRLTVSADQPLALVAVRLCHVLPDGASRLLAFGALNLAHRDGHERPEPLTPGEPATVRVTLRAIGQHVPAGHRLRVAVSPTAWPWLWPSPEPVALTLHLDAGNVLELPVVAADDEMAVSFGPPEQLDRSIVETLAQPSSTRTLLTDVASGHATQRWVDDRGRARIHDDGLEYGSILTQQYDIDDGDPLSASVTCSGRGFMERGPWQCLTEVRSSMRADAAAFEVEAEVVGRHGDEIVARRQFAYRIPRDHV